MGSIQALGPMAYTPAILFHATRREFAPGDVIIANADSTYYPNVLSLLEASRPDGYPSRTRCVFAAESAAAAYRFLMSQPSEDTAEIRVYRVQMENFHKAPFRLIHELKKRLSASAPTDSAVAEYWSPSYDWVFWEYFGPSFEVIEKLDGVNSVEVFAFGIRYEKDSDFSESL